jgi:anti-sigma B factor antagonist
VPRQAAIRSTAAVSSPYVVPRPFASSWGVGSWGAAWVRVEGELDLVSSPKLGRTIDEARQSGRRIVLDLREVSFIDSSGVHVIWNTALAVRREGGRLLVVRGPAHVDRVLSMLGVDKHVSMVEIAPQGSAPAWLHVTSEPQPRPPISTIHLPAR